MGRSRDWSLWRGGLVAEVLMCGGEHYGEFEGLVSVERWSGSRGAHVWWRTLWGGRGIGLCGEVVL